MKVIIFASILVTLVTCQAPGDETPSCLSAGPSNIKVLMDSNNYATLHGAGGVWTAADLDGSGITWTPGSGGNCQRTMYMCEKLPTSNNWIFTQYISKSVSAVANMTVYINVTLRFSTCTPACARSLGVYTFITNTPQTTINVSNFSLVSNFSASTTNILEPVLSFNLKPNDTGFYVAFRDGGSCINLNRVKIYYYQCPGQQIGLVLFPVTTAPTKSNSPLTVAASCVIGGVNTSLLNLQCNSSGAWSGSPSCICSLADGYMPSGPSSCAGCGAGYWLDVPTVSCQSCPPNSSSTSVVALECPCIAGYYRSSNEGPSIGCTAPPSGPNSLTVAAVTNTSITLQWGKPDDVGRNDYYFVLEYRSIGSIQFITVPNVTDTSDTIIYILSGLTPYTTYDINVIARNGVSDQDISNEYKRTSNVNTMTSQGVPGVIRGVLAIGQYVIWQPPTDTNGVITGYTLKVCRRAACNVLSFGSTTFLHQVQSSDVPSGMAIASVQVSASTMIGSGSWSSVVTLSNDTSCVQQQSTDSIQPSSTSTCPPITSCSVCPQCPFNTPLTCPSQQPCSKLIPVTPTPCPLLMPCSRSPSSSPPVCPQVSSSCPSCPPYPTPSTSCRVCSACPSILPSPISLSCPQVTSSSVCPPCPTSMHSPCGMTTVSSLVASSKCPACQSYPLPLSSSNSTFSSSVSSGFIPIVGTAAAQSNTSPLSCSAMMGISSAITAFSAAIITAIIVSFVCMVYHMKQKVHISAMNCAPATEMDAKM